MSSNPRILEEQYSKQIPDPSDQSGYQATVADPQQQKDLIEPEKFAPRPEDVTTWETEKEPDPNPGQGRSSGGKSQGNHHNQRRPGRMEDM